MSTDQPTPSSASSSKKNTYIMDQQNAREMARLLLQERLVTQAMGGPFSDRMDISRVRDVLDIACGPGGWVVDAAAQYPEMVLTGIDIDRMLIEYARAQATAFHLANARFKTMDATKPLKFADVSFDLINARLLFGFMLPDKWPRLVAECYRVLRPGGIIRLTECEAAFTNAPSFEQMAGYLAQALKLAGQSFSPDGRTINITPNLRRFLRDAGFQNISHAAYAIDWSYGAAAYESTVQNFFIGLELVQPFLVKMNVVTEEALEHLYHQSLVELQSPDFSAVWYYLSAWGTKMTPSMNLTEDRAQG